ncbi:ACT domain-containing protein [Burkholderia seminalis]|uniref:ACT domain-containing protein n=1 Tax=Burkholderia seminalis TaxID=488731 RepID=UPI001CF3995C|nr:ACT domain-containing protein [Burkholderia seminalis]MCA7955735.1 ACT domain-containing protein [Burkholderia seminalis]
MNFLTAITGDRTGLIAELSGLLAANDINVFAMDGRAIGTTAILQIDVDNLSLALAVLTRAGCQVISDEVLTLQVENVPGTLARVARDLADANLDIRMMRTISRQADICIVTIATNDNARAKQLLADRVV